jgi:hypothetical protein
MPYEKRFWESESLSDVKAYPSPTGVKGFITYLPVKWTWKENNDSGLNLTIIANILDENGDRALASSDIDDRDEIKNS